MHIVANMEATVECTECDFQESGNPYDIGKLGKHHREIAGHQVRVRILKV